MQEDYPSAMAQMRRALIPHFKRAKELKQEARLVKYKLFIERKEYTTKTAHLIANNLKMRDVAEKKTATHLFFLGATHRLVSIKRALLSKAFNHHTGHKCDTYTKF